MGAMAPPPQWTPRDDVLLKNAIEAGATMESLAKGAVLFSRRYTIQELQDRWLSLLYDPVISAEAAVHMLEIERPILINQSKSSNNKKLECPKESRNMNLEFIKELTGISGKRKTESMRKCYYARRKRICNEPFGMVGVNLLSQPTHSILGAGNPISSDLGIQGLEFDIRHHSFPEFGSDAPESIPPFSTDQTLDMSHNLLYPFQENLSPVGDQGEVLGYDGSKQLPISNVFEAKGIENKGLEYGGPSFHGFGCSPPLPQMPVWSTSSDIAATNLPAGGANETDAFRCDGAGPSSDLKAQFACDGISPEAYFSELSNTLFDFSSDEMIFMDNGKEPIDKSYLDGLSSLLLDSPNRGGELPDDNEVVGVSDGHFVQTSSVHSGEIHLGDDEPNIPGVQVASSASTVIPLGPEYRNGVICCVLNTEDPEIPDNDDVFLPFRCDSPSFSGMPSYLPSSSPMDFSGTQKANMVQNKQKGLCRSSRVMESSQPSDMGVKGPTGDHGVRFELPKSNILQAAVRSARNHELANHITSANLAANNAIGGNFRGNDWETGRGKSVDYKYHYRPDSLQIPRNEMDVKPEIPKDGSPNIDLTCSTEVVQNPIGNPPMSDHDGLWYEDDFDVPNFSDVEAMILDMDLCPHEFKISTLPQVRQYQHEETKRTIIRLEQVANACMQRAVATQGAFAVLYGRYSKYFIKKPEVLLGRATDDIVVDVDLGREKNGGQISRRQATLKIDTNGVFHLKNLGKCSTYVNGREVMSGQSTSLTTGCLIQIRSLAYLFETNDTAINQYKNRVTAQREETFDRSDKKPLQKS